LLHKGLNNTEEYLQYQWNQKKKLMDAYKSFKKLGSN
jgi:hypothetical protein